MENIRSAPRKSNASIRLIFHSTRPSTESKRASSKPENDRYGVCKLLADQQVPNVIWLEDLLALHGSNTEVWDLHLLVGDPRTAANALLNSGYKETPQEDKFENDPEFSERAIRMLHSQASTGVVFHKARDWYYEMDSNAQNFLPPLHSFLDSVIEFWLNISSRDYVDRLGFALYIGCLINYCYSLQTPDGELVKTPAYAEKLKPKHREVHYNITAADPKEESFTTTDRHLYHVRRSQEIRGGTFIPKPYEKGVFRAGLTSVSEQ